MFSVLMGHRANTVNVNNLLQYTIDGHHFGIKPLESQMNELQEYEGAVEEKVYQMEQLKQKEQKIKAKLDKMYLDLVFFDYRLERLEQHLTKVKLLQSTLWYPVQWSPIEVETSNNDRLCDIK
ncbi:MAG: hypothetical protein CL936_11090 [Deltaproteobacteria bacterium]|nr:hypothetical protein [Deltaproteobacteria bacterium]